MLPHLLKIALRNLAKQRAYALINVIGLAVGLASCILIALWVMDEISYDSHHDGADRIYRLSRDFRTQSGEVSLHLGNLAPPFGRHLMNEFPEVDVTRISYWGWDGIVLDTGTKKQTVSNFFFGDSTLWDVFTLPMVHGNPETALDAPFKVVLSESVARQLYGDINPVGSELRVIDDESYTIQVTGVFEDMPHNVHNRYEVIASQATVGVFWKGIDDNFGSNNWATYVKLPQGMDPAWFEAQLAPFVDKIMAPVWDDLPEGRTPWFYTQLHMWPLRDVHLKMHLDGMGQGGDMQQIYLLSFIALLILGIACINFMNLATARSAQRAKEVGLRKVVGARRRQLIGQFLGEAVLLSLLAMILAIGIVELVMPIYNDFTDKQLALTDRPLLTAVLFAAAALVGLGAGSYPALFLSAFRPARVLKGELRTAAGGKTFRTLLVGVQFAITVGLLVAVQVVTMQVHYARTCKLGLNEEQVLTAYMGGDMFRNWNSIRQRIEAIPGVENVGAGSRPPSSRLLDSGSAGYKPADGDSTLPFDVRVAVIHIDHGYFPTIEVPFAAGRNIDPARSVDSTESFIVNEATVRAMGIDSPQEAIGKYFYYSGRAGEIVGVVEDFHFESLHNRIAPIAFFYEGDENRNAMVRIRAGEVDRVVAELKAIWADYRPDHPFDWVFLDERYANLYEAEERAGRIYATFAGLALFIAGLGLFGLAAYMVERRTKEIGIRRVLGASEFSIIRLLNREYTVLVIVSAAAAWPFAWYMMQGWLEQFAYRIELGVPVFALSGLAALLLAWATVTFQAARAARMNPARTLRDE
ncbi:FtsX-like permease family protein [bacterium]|nr:FtsX-like permease family protein [bacterium]